MKANSIFLLIAAPALAMAAYAGEATQTRTKMVVVDGSADDEIRVELDSEDLGFDLHDMQVGENQSIVDDQGRNILVSREEDGFLFNVDGKEIRLPAMDSEYERVWLHTSGADVEADVDVEVIHDESHSDNGEGVKIIKKKIEIRKEEPQA